MVSTIRNQLVLRGIALSISDCEMRHSTNPLFDFGTLKGQTNQLNVDYIVILSDCTLRNLTMSNQMPIIQSSSVTSKAGIHKVGSNEVELKWRATYTLVLAESSESKADPITHEIEIVMTSSTEGKSEPIELGNEGSLQFDTPYTITLHLSSDSSLTAITPTILTIPAGQNTVLVARGGSDRIAECGGKDEPCRTVWTGQMAGKGKGGERMSLLVQGDAEMGDGFWIWGKVGMTLSSESATQRSRVVVGSSSFSSTDGIVSISSATVEVMNLNMILPSSEEYASSGWVSVVESEGDLEIGSMGLSGEGQIGVGLAKVKSGTGRFNSISISSGSFGGVGMIVGEGKWNQISMLISAFVIRDTTTSKTPLISFSSLSPLSTFKMDDLILSIIGFASFFVSVRLAIHPTSDRPHDDRV